MKYTVHINAQIETTVDVEANSEDEARQEALDQFEYTGEAYNLDTTVTLQVEND